jgi:hypothetical protein
MPKREELVDAAERVVDALVEEVSPGGHDHGAGCQQAGPPAHPADRLPQVAQRVLEHEPADPGPGVDGGEDEQGL